MSCLGASLVKVVQISSSRSSSRWARSRSWRISRSPPSRTLRRTSDLAPLGLELGQVGLELLRPGLQVGIALILDGLLLDDHLGFERGAARCAASRSSTAVIDVGREVDDLFQILRGQVEQVAQPARARP